MKFYTSEGISKILELLKTYLTNKFNIVNQDIDRKVDKNGSDRLMTANEGNKLSGIEDNAQSNTIESISLNGNPISPDLNKNVNLEIESGKQEVFVFESEDNFPAQGAIDTLYISQTSGKSYIWEVISNDYTFSGSYCTIDNTGKSEAPITMEATITNWSYPVAPSGTWIGFQNNSYPSTEPPYTGVAFDAIMTKIGKTAPIAGDKITFYKYDGITSIIYNSEGTDYDISDCLYVTGGTTYGHDLYIVANANQQFSGVLAGPGAATYRGYQNLQKYKLVKTEVDWSEILNKPTLGTASSKDAPESGDATNVQVVMGNDSRLTDARLPVAHIHDKTDINDFAWFDDHIYTSYEDLLLNSKMELGGFYKVTENNGTKKSYYVVENKNKPNDVEYNIHNNRKNYVYISNTQATGHTDKPVIFVYRPNIESKYNEFNISSAVIDIIFTANTSSYTPQKHFLINCALIKSISGISTLKKNESIIIYTGDKKAILVKEDGTKIDISGAILDSYVIAGATLTTETFYLRTDNTGTTQGFSNVQDIAVHYFGSSEDDYYIEIAEIYSGNLSDGDIFDYQYKELINSIDQTSELALKQPKILDTPITISGITYTTVESVLSALSSGAVGNGVEMVSQLPSASADTMEKLYVLMAANSDPELYVTTVSNNVYSWFKLSGSDLKRVDNLPANPSNGDMVILNEDGHVYKYVSGGSGETLYAWTVDNPGGIGDGDIIYTKTASPSWEDPTIYKSDGTAYSSPADDPTYEIMDGGEFVIEIEIFSVSQQESWDRNANRTPSEDITPSVGQWVDIIENYIYDADWVSQGDISFNGRQAFHGHTTFYDGSDAESGQTPEFYGSVFFGQNQSENGVINFEPPVTFHDSIYFNNDPYGSGGDYYIDKNGDASLHDISTGEILATGITMVEYNGDINMNGNDLNAVGEINIGGQVLPINGPISVSGNADFNSYNIENVNELHVYDLYVGNDFSLSGDLSVSGTITDGSGNSLVYDNDSRLSDAREPLSHEHTINDITDFPTYGTTSGTICEGNDNRLSDNRFPTNDNNLVHKTDNESISGNKTFSQNVNITGELSANTATVQNLKANSYNGYAEYLKALNSSNIELYRFVTIDKDSGYLKYTQADEGVIIGVTTPNALITGSNQSVASGEKNVLIGLLGSFWVTINPDLDLDSLKPGDYVCAGDSGTADSTTTTSQMRNDIFQVLKVDIENRRCLVLVK